MRLATVSISLASVALVELKFETVHNDQHEKYVKRRRRGLTCLIAGHEHGKVTTTGKLRQNGLSFTRRIYADQSFRKIAISKSK